MNAADYTHITPLGAVNPTGHVFPTSHVYFGLGAAQGAPGTGLFGDGRTFPPKPVFAPADGVIVKAATSMITKAGGGEPTLEYDLTIAVCQQQYLRYGHIGPVSARIAGWVASLTGDCFSYETGGSAIVRCEYNGALDVSAGEELAKTSGLAAAFDLGAWDPTTARAGFSKPQLYGLEAANNYCPLDLFVAAQKDALYGKLGDGNGTKPPAGWCGRVNYDVPGTLQGNWFKDISQFTAEDGNISFAFDNIDPVKPVISNGTSLPGLPAGTYAFAPGSDGWSNPAFSGVSVGENVYCYSGLTNARTGSAADVTLYVRVVTNGELWVDTAPGSACGASIPWQLSGGAVTFKR